MASCSHARKSSTRFALLFLWKMISFEADQLGHPRVGTIRVPGCARGCELWENRYFQIYLFSIPYIRNSTRSTRKPTRCQQGEAVFFAWYYSQFCWEKNLFRVHLSIFAAVLKNCSFTDIANAKCIERPASGSWRIVADVPANLDCSQELTLIFTSSYHDIYRCPVKGVRIRMDQLQNSNVR